MIILLKIILIIAVLTGISPFVMMATAFIGGSTVAPGTSRKDYVICWTLIYLGLALIYIGFPVLVFLL